MSSRRGRTVWAGILLVGLAAEAWGVAHPDDHDTLSEFTRWALATDTETGRLVFGLGWTAFWGWFLVHILRGRNSSEDQTQSGGYWGGT